MSCSKSTPAAPTPPVTPSGLIVSGPATLTDFNQVAQLTATLTFSNNTQQDQTLAATWTSSNTSVATVTGTGLVRAITTGAATITAAFSGQSGTRPMTVTIACQVNNTATVTLGNRGSVTQIGVWDGFSVGTIAPGQNAAPFTALAGIPHTLAFRVASTGLTACSQATPVLQQCATPLFTCSF